MVSVKLSDNATVYETSLMGNRLTREVSASINMDAALVRLGDKNLLFTFEESDREELMQIDTKLFALLTSELNTEILTHTQLADMLLPAKVVVKPKPKPKPKTTTNKPKKSSLVE